MVTRTRCMMSVVALCVTAGGCGVNRALEEVHEARHLAADLQVQFTKATDASNLAVMADTDEASVAFAREAERRTATVTRETESLAPILHRLGFTEESRLLAEFRARFEEYRQLDRVILDLAVENTNLKAQRLSFGSARAAADRVAGALDALEPSSDSREGWHVKALAATVVARTREIEALHAPHIAAPDDPTMTQLEKRMTTAEQSARTGLTQLASLVSPRSRPSITAAASALDRLVDVNRQLVQLSRRNTNVRSLALSLSEKRPVIDACEASLHSLQAALSKRGYTGPGRFPRPG
jgi:hypothetical protein